MRRLSASFTEEREKERIRKDLEGRLPAFRSDSWWAMGKAEVADLHQRGSRPNRRVNARREAEEGRAAYPSSLGGQRCLSIVKSIEAPEVRLQAMSVDGPGKRSIEVSHRNLGALHFRAAEAGRGEADRGLEGLVGPPDVRRHEEARLDARRRRSGRSTCRRRPTSRRTGRSSRLPCRSPGFYVVLASARKDFGASDNVVVGTNLFVSDLVLVVRPEAETGAVVGPRPLRRHRGPRSPAPRSRSGASTGGRGTAGTR